MRPSERTVRDATDHEGRTFDVQPTRDDGALAYPVRPLLGAMRGAAADTGVAEAEPFARAWRRGAVLDQGQEGACTGHGVTQELISTPVRVDFAKADLPEGAPTKAQDMAFWIYEQARDVDEWPDNTTYSGTSVNAGMLVARRLGFIAGWRWAQTHEDLRDTLVHVGPVILAMPWKSGMYEAPGGELTIAGEQVGWHCILANGWHPAMRVNGEAPREMVRLTNSWGTGWGQYGSAWIDAAELWALIAESDGEMVVPLGRELHALTT